MLNSNISPHGSCNQNPLSPFSLLADSFHVLVSLYTVSIAPSHTYFTRDFSSVTPVSGGWSGIFTARLYVLMWLYVCVHVGVCGCAQVRRSMEFGLGVQEVHPERLDGQDDHEHGNGDPAQPGSVDEKSTEESKVPTSLESRTKATHSILHHASAPSSIEAPSMSAFLSHFTPTDQTFNPPSTRCATTPSATDPSPTSDIFCASTSAVHAPSDMQEPLLLGIKSEAVVELLQHEVCTICVYVCSFQCTNHSNYYCVVLYCTHHCSM